MSTLVTAERTGQAASTTWAIDPSHSAIEFAVKHMVFATAKGRFAQVAGAIVLDESDPTRSSVFAEIPSASIDTHDDKRDAHLRSADFLEAETYPSITFRSTKVASRSDGRLAILGDLTIHGVTRPVELDAEMTGRGTDPWGGKRSGFAATAKINRTDFGLTWNQALEAGGLLVGEEVKISLEIEAILQDA